MKFITLFARFPVLPGHLVATGYASEQALKQGVR